MFYDKPFLKFERLLETYLAFAPRGFRSFRMAIPLWLREKLFLKDLLRRELRRQLPQFDAQRLLFSEHHLSHAASAFYPSPFERAAILTLDGVGEWATSSLAIGEGNRVRIVREMHFPHSLGLLYSAFTYYTGFKVNSGEYKLMGLAPYGTPKYAQLILDRLVDVKEDGSFRLNLDYFDYCTGLTMTNGRFDQLFGGPPRAPEELLTQHHMDVAASIQAVTEEVMLRLTRSVAQQTGERNLCLAGGVALNCVANGKILRDGRFDGLWIQPAAGDAGGALGAAYAAYYGYAGKARTASHSGDQMSGSYLGPEFGQAEVERRLRACGARFETLDEQAMLLACARDLADGRAVGWFQGRMEFGPRALGARSILGDARSPTMQKMLNLKVKYRESFRPFAPAVLREHVARVVRAGRRQPLHAAGRGGRQASAPRHERCAAGAVRDRQAQRRPLRHSGGHPCGLLRQGSDRSSRDQSEVPRADQRISRDDRLPGAGQYQLQRPRRADRLHAGGCVPLLHGDRDRDSGRRQLDLAQRPAGCFSAAELYEQVRGRLSDAQPWQRVIWARTCCCCSSR